MMEWLRPSNWTIFEDQENFVHFLRIFFFVLMASVFIGVAVAPVLGLIIFIPGTIIALLISTAHLSFGNFIGRGLFLGSRKKDEAAILKGMYKVAHGLRLTGKNSEAEKVYNGILQDYPEELNARYYLGMTLWKDLKQSKKALKIFNDLEKNIRLGKLNFQYRQALKESIRELKEEMSLSP